MTEQWDGRPENPERDGWHWLHHHIESKPKCVQWVAEIDAWASGEAYSPEGVVELGWRYRGPCLTPAEVAAREAAGRREGIEAAWGVVADEPVPEGELTFHEVMQRDERMMERIRALLAEREEAIDQRNAADPVLAIVIEQSTRHSAERDAARAERDEAIATLALYRAEQGCTRGQRTTQWCGEATKVRRAWLRVIQAENSCPASGGGCLSTRCGCVAEMDALLEAGR